MSSSCVQLELHYRIPDIDLYLVFNRRTRSWTRRVVERCTDGRRRGYRRRLIYVCTSSDYSRDVIVSLYCLFNLHRTICNKDVVEFSNIPTCMKLPETVAT